MTLVRLYALKQQSQKESSCQTSSGMGIEMEGSEARDGAGGRQCEQRTGRSAAECRGARRCVGKRKHLFIGLNVVAALQRNECVGRSWRGVWGDG